MKIHGRHTKSVTTGILVGVAFVAVTFWVGTAWGEQSILEVRAKVDGTIPQVNLQKVKDLSYVLKVEPSLHIRKEIYQVVGVEPGAPLRIVTSDNRLIIPTPEAGWTSFKSGDDRVSIMGLVHREEIEREGKPDPMHGMGGMLHLFEVGSSFLFPGMKERVRVIGLVSGKPEADARKVFLPLTTAQRLFGKAGQLTHLFVTVESVERVEAVATGIRSALGEAVEVVRH